MLMYYKCILKKIDDRRVNKNRNNYLQIYRATHSKKKDIIKTHMKKIIS